MPIAEPKVTLLASTALHSEAVNAIMEEQPDSTPAETIVTLGGRNCYDSFHRPKEGTRRDEDYIRRTIGQEKHGSISEHASGTLYFEGVSRAFLTELSRHRHLSLSVRSQRFVNEDDSSVVVPPAIKGTISESYLERINADLTQEYGEIVEHLITLGNSRKQAREAARAILPNMTETKIVATANLRTWGEVIVRRCAPDADAEMQEVMGMALTALEPVSPVFTKMWKESIEESWKAVPQI